MRGNSGEEFLDRKVGDGKLVLFAGGHGCYTFCYLVGVSWNKR